MGCEGVQRRLFVFAREAAVAADVGSEYGGALAFPLLNWLPDHLSPPQGCDMTICCSEARRTDQCEARADDDCRSLRLARACPGGVL